MGSPRRDCSEEARRIHATPSPASTLTAGSPVTRLSDGSTIRGFWFEPVPCETECIALTVYFTEPGSDFPLRTTALRKGDRFGRDNVFVLEQVGIRRGSLGGSKDLVAAILVGEATIRHRVSNARYVLTADGVRNLVRQAD